MRDTSDLFAYIGHGAEVAPVKFVYGGGGG
jgi:hypothetical protein